MEPKRLRIFFTNKMLSTSLLPAAAARSEQKYSCFITAKLLCLWSTLTAVIVFAVWLSHHRHNLKLTTTQNLTAPKPPVPTCPGSPALLHAACAFTFTIPDHSCHDVQEEVERRLQGLDKWKDPQLGGKYKLLESHTKGNRSTLAQHSIAGAGAKERDLLTFAYCSGAKEKSKTCFVSACSQSQQLSLYDVSVNFCNLHNLICGKNKGCKTSRHDFSMVTDIKLIKCPFHNEEKCFAKQTELINP